MPYLRTFINQVVLTLRLVFHLNDIELEYGVPISVNIKNEKHFKNWVNSLPYYSNIQKEGIIIA